MSRKFSESSCINVCMKNHSSAGFSLPNDWMEKIDSERGDISRSRYLLRLLEYAYPNKKLRMKLRVRVRNQESGKISEDKETNSKPELNE